jgi:hypothetical protein
MILPYSIEANSVARDVRTATDLIDSVVVGRKPLHLICSSSGFAKSSITYQRCKAHGIVKFEPDAKTGPSGFFSESRPTRANVLAHVLWECVQRNVALLLMDDPGHVEVLDICKTAFGMQRECILETPEIKRNERYRQAGSNKYDRSIPPVRFSIGDLRWLWLANTNYADVAVRAKLGDHFAPLIARGLNPFWITDDREHDNYDLLLYVHHLDTVKNLLRSMGFPYGISRQAVNFYVTHCHQLYDLAPRRLELIANAFRFDNAAARDAELASMLSRDDLRPRLKLPESWVAVPDGVLLWPDTPFSTKREAEREPKPAPEYMGGLEVGKAQATQGISRLELTSESDRAQRPGQTQTFACQSTTSPEPGSQTSIEGESLESQLARQKALTAALHRQIMELTTPAKSRRKPRNRRGADA